MRLTRKDLDDVDLERLRPFVRESEWFYKEPGVEHYKLLAHLSTLFNNQTIFDIGSHFGDSAHALAYNPTNRVESFDIVDEITDFRRQRSNITFHIANLFDASVRETWKQQLLDSPLIFIDIAPHEGRLEHALVRWLQANAYKGLIVLDDIWHFKEMRDNLWYQIEPQFRTDLTYLGHWSGTGVVSFDRRVEHEHTTDTSNWTLVTAYFDLTRTPDASDEIKARPASHYLDEHATSTLALDKNLIVFCEPENREKILSIRPRHLHDRTQIIEMSFEDFPLTQHRDQITANRDGQCRSDSRNTASYYLLCMARYAMLKRVIKTNPFGSTHFAWINICIERMGFQNLAHLDEALGQQRDKFSTCYIDYVPKQTVQNLDEYFNGKQCRGRCSMCSGFFTGNAKCMQLACDKIEEQFLICLEAGYGHADEQLFSRVYFEHPELFDWYCGDYQEMITNYAYVYARPERPIHHLIRNSFNAQDWDVCAQACNFVWRSYVLGKCALNDHDLRFLLTAKHAAETQRAT